MLASAAVKMRRRVVSSPWIFSIAEVTLGTLGHCNCLWLTRQLYAPWHKRQRKNTTNQLWMHFATVLRVRMRSQLVTIRIRMWLARAAAAKSMTVVVRRMSLLIVRGRPLALCSKNKQNCDKGKKVVSSTSQAAWLFFLVLRIGWTCRFSRNPHSNAVQIRLMTVDAPAEHVWSNFCCFFSSHQMRCVQGSLTSVGVGVPACPLRCRSPRRPARCTWSGALFCGQANWRRTDRGGSSRVRDTIPDRLWAENNNYDVLCARTQKKHEALCILCLERCRLPVSDCHEHGQDAAHQNVIAVETSHPTRGNKWPPRHALKSAEAAMIQEVFVLAVVSSPRFSWPCIEFSRTHVPAEWLCFDQACPSVRPSSRAAELARDPHVQQCRRDPSGHALHTCTTWCRQCLFSA